MGLNLEVCIVAIYLNFADFKPAGVQTCSDMTRHEWKKTCIYSATSLFIAILWTSPMFMSPLLHESWTVVDLQLCIREQD